MMAVNISRQSAHPTFPLSLPALQSASLRPDFQYPKISLARTLSAHLATHKLAFSPGELATIGLMGKVYLTIIQRYLDQTQVEFALLDDYLYSSLGRNNAQAALGAVIDSFPTTLTHADPSQKQAYNFDAPGSEGYRFEYYYSLLLVLVAEENAAIRSRDGVFTDPQLRKSSLFKTLLHTLTEFFADQPALISGGASLIDFILLPGRLYPDSIFDQLQYIRVHWSEFLDPELFRALLLSLDRLKEEIIPGLPGQQGLEDPLGYFADNELLDIDLVGYSLDRDWMPEVILQAKNIYVWLDQLSREYKRTITSLDLIPDEELIKLARRGINALWLIGLWERSPASQKIKQLCGNPEAASSAYSLFDYRLADNLGGDPAYQHLSNAAARYNIRLAADMVPNHVGIDSRWIIDHPDWFLSLDHPPFPGYSFTGADLSSDPAVSIFLEDHYYDKTDAAVVFKRVNNHTGEARYIYHGNDGTSMPWNDTAQLDFLNPEVREAVIQTVLHVARKFPIIRFDAAMTLTKKHYQRLWFPQPGTGGAIPTRTDFSLNKNQFNASMPEEFWRELVDRVADDVPDTLLLAEAFWMMEGYFVRTLGMHRVYNSAFMHMLRDEDNEKYRDLIIKTLTYDPQILKRYVNFMNNPDEETAISQFGSDGKYFGTCLLMSTLPGLPMFGHGQIEGFAEKYGMEFKKAYYNESPNQALIDRHQREIAPLLRRRYLFAEVNYFLLYDLVTAQGIVNHDVFAYSNRFGSEQALIIYHNKWGHTQGWIARSVSINGQATSLLDGLGYSAAYGKYLIFKDQISNLEYIRPLNQLAEEGLYLELGAYQYHAFVDFRTDIDQDGTLSALDKILNGKGTPSLSMLMVKHKHKPLFDHFSSLLSPWQSVLEGLRNQEDGIDLLGLSESDATSAIAGPGVSFFKTAIDLIPELSSREEKTLKAYQKKISSVIALINSPIADLIYPDLPTFLPWTFLSEIYPLLSEDAQEIAIQEACIASEPVGMTLLGDAVDPINPNALRLSLSLPVTEFTLDADNLAGIWFNNPETQKYIQLHTFEGETWFHKESMESLINLHFGLYFISLVLTKSSNSKSFKNQIQELTDLHNAAINSVEKSQFQVEPFIRAFSHLSSGK